MPTIALSVYYISPSKSLLNGDEIPANLSRTERAAHVQQLLAQRGQEWIRGLLERLAPQIEDRSFRLIPRDKSTPQAVFAEMDHALAVQLGEDQRLTVKRLGDVRQMKLPETVAPPAKPVPGPVPAEPARPRGVAPRTPKSPRAYRSRSTRGLLDHWHFEAVGLPREPVGPEVGRGVQLAVLDTGIDASHPDLAGKVVAQYRISRKSGRTRREPNPSDTLVSGKGHGTFVAGLICGARTGLAPGATILSVVMLPGGTGTLIDFVAAVNLASQRPAVRLMVVCWGFTGADRQFLQGLCDGLIALGILPIVAVGNSGPGDSVSPGNCAGVVSVGSMTRSGEVATFSSSESFGRGSNRYHVPSLVAPAEEIYSCGAGGGYIAMTGSTAATAIVAGMAARILHFQPDLGIAQLRETLLSSCRRLDAPADRQGHGLIQVGEQP